MMHVLMVMSGIAGCRFFLFSFFGSFRLGLEWRKSDGLRFLIWQFDKRDNSGVGGEREVPGTFQYVIAHRQKLD